MNRSADAAGTRAAQAALTPAQDTDFERYLLVDDTDDFTTEIRTILRERSPRGLEVLS
ncbi:MAG: hypothetical protein WAN86_17185 [Hyphomicrobiaceae bacterium]